MLRSSRSTSALHADRDGGGVQAGDAGADHGDLGGEGRPASEPLFPTKHPDDAMRRLDADVSLRLGHPGPGVGHHCDPLRRIFALDRAQRRPVRRREVDHLVEQGAHHRAVAEVRADGRPHQEIQRVVRGLGQPQRGRDVEHERVEAPRELTDEDRRLAREVVVEARAGDTCPGSCTERRPGSTWCPCAWATL
jgi:hypothetical protein